MAAPVAKPTGRFDTLVATGRNALLPPHGGGENRLVMAFIVVSVIAHAGVMLLSNWKWSSAPPIISDEWSMDADLITDVDPTSPATSALPDAAPAPAPKVAETMLPQLTKTVSAKENTKAEDEIAEEKVEDKPKDEAKPAEKEQKAEDLKIKTENKTDNQLDQKELLKRAAMESLRRQEQTAKANEAPEKDVEARIADALLKTQSNNPAFASASGKGRINAYGALLKRAIRRNYDLPEAYNLKGANLQVQLELTIGANGELLDLKVNKSSGESVFDEMTLRAVRTSAPLPKPPEELAGNAVLLNFDP